MLRARARHSGRRLTAGALLLHLCVKISSILSVFPHDTLVPLVRAVSVGGNAGDRPAFAALDPSAEEAVETIFGAVAWWRSHPIAWDSFVKLQVLPFLENSDEYRKQEVLKWFGSSDLSLSSTTTTEGKTKILPPPEGRPSGAAKTSEGSVGHGRTAASLFTARLRFLRKLKEFLLLLFAGREEAGAEIAELRAQDVEAPEEGYEAGIPSDAARQSFLAACKKFFEKVLLFPSDVGPKLEALLQAHERLLQNLNHGWTANASHYLNKLVKEVQGDKRKSFEGAEASLVKAWEEWRPSRPDAYWKNTHPDVAAYWRDWLRSQRQGLLLGRAVRVANGSPIDLWRAWRQTVLTSEVGEGERKRQELSDQRFDASTETPQWQQPLWFAFLCLQPGQQVNHLLSRVLDPDGGVGGFVKRLRGALRRAFLAQQQGDAGGVTLSLLQSTQWRALISGRSGYDQALDDYLQPFALLTAAEELVDMRAALEECGGGKLSQLISVELLPFLERKDVRLFSGHGWLEEGGGGGAGRHRVADGRLALGRWIGGSALQTLLTEHAAEAALMRLESAERLEVPVLPAEDVLRGPTFGDDVVCCLCLAGFFFLVGVVLFCCLICKCRETKKLLVQLEKRRDTKRRRGGGVDAGRHDNEEEGLWGKILKSRATGQKDEDGNKHRNTCCAYLCRGKRSSFSSSEDLFPKNASSSSSLSGNRPLGRKEKTGVSATATAPSCLSSSRDISLRQEQATLSRSSAREVDKQRVDVTPSKGLYSGGPSEEPKTVPHRLPSATTASTKDPQVDPPRVVVEDLEAPPLPKLITCSSSSGLDGYNHTALQDQALLGLDNPHLPPATVLGRKETNGVHEQLISYREVKLL